MIVSHDEKTVQRNFNAVPTGTTISIFYNPYNNSRRNSVKYNIKHLILAGCLDHYASANALECPTGRGSQEENPLMLLINSLTKVDVHDDYIKKCQVLRDYAIGAAGVQDQPSAPLSYSTLFESGTLTTQHFE